MRRACPGGSSAVGEIMTSSIPTSAAILSFCRWQRPHGDTESRTYCRRTAWLCRQAIRSPARWIWFGRESGCATQKRCSTLRSRSVSNSGQSLARSCALCRSSMACLTTEPHATVPGRLRFLFVARMHARKRPLVFVDRRRERRVAGGGQERSTHFVGSAMTIVQEISRISGNWMRFIPPRRER